MRLRLTFVAFVILFVSLVGATDTEAQLLDKTWVRLTVNSSGVSFNNVTNTLGRRIAFKGTCFMRVVWNAAQSYHEGRVACMWVDGLWYDTESLFVFDELGNGDFWGWEQWGRFFNLKAHDIWGWVHLFVSPVVKKGALQQIQVTGVGRVTDGNVVGTAIWGPYGPYSIKGSAVPPSKVPPAVRALFP
jgi:hypothetical protein